MKVKTRIFLVIAMIATLSILAIFSGERESHKPTVVIPPRETLPPRPNLTLDAYMPIDKDTVWTYETSKGELQVWVDFFRENVYQMRFKLDESIFAKVYVEEEEGIYEVASIEDAEAKIDYTHLRQYKNPILRTPIEKGTVWELSDGSSKEIISIEEKVSTPIGQVNTIKVKSASEGYEATEYFGEQLGIIYGEYKGESSSFFIKLKNIEMGTRVTDYINVYRVNKQTKKVEMFTQPILMRTNEEASHFITDLLKKTPNERYLGALPTSAMITKIYQDQKMGQVHVELNEAYLHREYTSEEEDLAIQCLVNTIADYYNVQEVGITVEGSPYYSWVKKH